jgi:hypothetical protein
MARAGGDFERNGLVSPVVSWQAKRRYNSEHENRCPVRHDACVGYSIKTRGRERARVRGTVNRADVTN